MIDDEQYIDQSVKHFESYSPHHLSIL